MRFAGTRKLWQNLLDKYDWHQVVCGYAVTGLPQAMCDKRYVICAATSMEGDKRARLEKTSLLRRLAHRMQVDRLREIERLVLEKAAYVLAISPYTRLDLIEHGASAERTEIIRTPIDIERFRPGLDAPEQFTVMWTCRHSDARKRTSDLIRAFAVLAKKAPRARLALVGEGSADAINRLATELGIAGQVAYLGRRPDAEMPSLYNRASVFAIPSDQEGLGIAGLEAMACEVPVVSTRCGGTEAFVVPNETGILVDRGSVEQLADALIHLYRNEDERVRLGRQSRVFVEQNYSVEQFAKQMRLVYNKVWPEAFGQRGPSKDSQLIGA
jgi:glycosyltransferase involved in cell wall biosynthesis